MASCSHNNPRKFSEKIALHRQKEAEEKAEYDKIMSECALVKGTARPIPGSEIYNNSINHQGAYNPIGSPMSGDIATRLLPPNMSTTSHMHHGSLPNVNSAIQSMPRPRPSADDTPLILNQRLQHNHHHHHHHHQSPRHVSLRDQQQQPLPVPPSSSSGPIRSLRNRIDTSPYGSSAHLLPPPNPDWRRTVSDSSLHHSVIGDAEMNKNSAALGHKQLSRGDEDGRSVQNHSTKQSSQNLSGYLLPNDPGDHCKKMGSLPDLSSFTNVLSNQRINDNRTVENGSNAIPIRRASDEKTDSGMTNGGHLIQTVHPHSMPNCTSPDARTSPNVPPWSPNHQSEKDYGRNNPSHNHLYTSTGSPMSYGNRCTSPIDVGGSPHSPLGLSMSPTTSPSSSSVNNGHLQNNPSFEDLETYSQDQLDLNREFQRFTMMDSMDNTTQYSNNSYYSRRDDGCYDANQQPMNELVNFFTSMDSKSNNNQIHQSGLVQTPQTPSSIPDIILTDDAGTDQDLQGLAMTTAFECLSDDSLKADLGKLDDSMLRLLTETAGSDQAIADPITEEHLKLI